MKLLNPFNKSSRKPKSKRSKKQMKNFRKLIKTITRAENKRIWEKIKTKNLGGPTVGEYFKSIGYKI